ncbi:hypothetical protein FRC07_009382 [Ceratobasidium sp. 392]|nr:hypothetical protein FRC07_009382 [Ceratobasidium sp. 392]
MKLQFVIALAALACVGASPAPALSLRQDRSGKEGQVPYERSHKTATDTGVYRIVATRVDDFP